MGYDLPIAIAAGILWCARHPFHVLGFGIVVAAMIGPFWWLWDKER